VSEIVEETDAAAQANDRRLTTTLKLVNKRIDRLRETTSETVSARQLNVWALTIAGILAALGIGFLVARVTILNPMMVLTNVAREISETGNFSKRIGISSTDEIGKASRAIDKLLDNTQGAFLEIESLFSKVAEGNLAARMPEHYAGDIGRASDHIATSLGRLSSTLEKILLDVQQVASASASAGEAVGQIADGARAQVEATKGIQDRMSTSAEIAGSVDESAKSTSAAAANATKVAALGSTVAGDMVSIMGNIQENSSKISEIVDLIQDIAQQTTMLAINASIESARAGEAGRGFSVVATEVGKLADRSSSSVKNILELTTAADDQANRGTTQMGELQSEMLRIGETINEIERMMAAVVQESTKQREALDQVEEATNNLERIGEANAVAAEEITASMLQLSRIASNAKSSIDEFSLGQSEHDDELPTDDSETGNDGNDEIANADGVPDDQ
jgi:methyl-accepting chemotaxis protein